MDRLEGGSLALLALAVAAGLATWYFLAALVTTLTLGVVQGLSDSGAAALTIGGTRLDFTQAIAYGVVLALVLGAVAVLRRD